MHMILLNRKFCLSAIIILLSSVFANAQDEKTRAEEYRQQQEQLKKTAVLKELDSGVYYMDQGLYEAADEKFRYVLSNVKSVPSDLTFYFGKNSYYLGKYKQSIDWLNKYIQLKGTNGQFSQDAVQWLRRSEEEFVKERSQESRKAEQILAADYNIDCGPTGKVTCPVCKGDHVIIKRGPFGNSYKTCEYCDEHGLLTCEEYNLLLRGQLKPKN
jgi:tetratricopeptide (TPR) repeat protein